MQGGCANRAICISLRSRFTSSLALATKDIPMAAPTDSFEIFINEQRADIAFFRIMLTVLLVRLIGATPALAEERLRDIKTTVTDAIGRMQANPAESGEIRWKHLVAMRGDKFFVELEELFHQVRTMTGEAGRN
jgi:hypothetical protein